MKLRIKFKKYGPVRFIGHLDVMRFFQKAIRRAGIDVTYTTGFSPHQVMSFAAPLGVGLTSNGEYMDIQVNSLPMPDSTDMCNCGKSNSSDENGLRDFYNSELNPCQLLVQRLNAASVEGLDVVSARILPDDAGNAMASVAAASYTIRFRKGREPAMAQPQKSAEVSSHTVEDVFTGSVPPGSLELEPMQAAISSFLAKEEIWITKETKRGTREVNLRPGIYELTWHDNAFFMLVDASSAGNIKPAQVIGALLEDCGESLQENALLVTREDVFTDLGEDGSSNLVSLGDIGYAEPFATSETKDPAPGQGGSS